MGEGIGKINSEMNDKYYDMPNPDIPNYLGTNSLSCFNTLLFAVSLILIGKLVCNQVSP